MPGLSPLPTVPQHIGSCWDGPVRGALLVMRFALARVPATNRASQNNIDGIVRGKGAEPLFQHTTLIDAQWLLDFATEGNAGEARRRAAVAPAREGDCASGSAVELPVRGALPIGVLSYGFGLVERIQIRRGTASSDSCRCAIVAFWCDGEHETTSFGIVWDYSLPQHGYTRESNATRNSKRRNSKKNDRSSRTYMASGCRRGLVGTSNTKVCVFAGVAVFEMLMLDTARSAVLLLVRPIVGVAAARVAVLCVAMKSHTIPNEGLVLAVAPEGHDRTREAAQ